jgi:hypothetical protein
MSPKFLRILKWIIFTGLALFILLIAIVFILISRASMPLPTGKTGPEAEALAQAMLDATNDQAWQQVGAVSWNFRGAQDHLWDRQRHYGRIRWENIEVLINLSDRSGIVKVDGSQITGEEATAHLEQAWAHWANDSFWLNPVTKVFDEGTSRSIVETDEGAKGLLISYASGGVTPGDSYLWILDENNMPIAWRMWVSILPIDGLKATWEGWITLDGGAKVSTTHGIGPLTLELTDIKAATTVYELEGNDPFSELAK